MDRSNYARSRLDVVLAENKQLKKRLEAAERDNRELKLSVYELSARLSAALARGGHPNGYPSGLDRPAGDGAHGHHGTLADDVAAQVLASDLASGGQGGISGCNGGDGSSSAPPADGRHFTPSATLSGHAGAVYAVAFAPSGRLLASGSFDKSVRCWAMDEMEPRETLCLQKHTHNVSTLSWSADARALLSGSYDHSVRLWDVEAATCARSWTVPEAAFVQAVAHHPTSPHVFAAATTGPTLLLYDARRAGDAPAATLPNGTMVNAVTFLPAGEHCLTGDKHGALRAWDLRARACVAGLYAGDAHRPISHITLSEPVPVSSRAPAAGYAPLGGGGGGLVGGVASGSLGTNGSVGGVGGSSHHASGAAEPRLLAVNSYDDTLRVYDRGYAPLRALVPPADDGATPFDEPVANAAESPSKARECDNGRTGSEAGASNASSPSGAGAAANAAHADSAAHGHDESLDTGGHGLDGDENDGAYAACVHALVGHRNRSYPIRSAMRVGAEFARGSAARRAAVVDVSNHGADDDNRRIGGGYGVVDFEPPAPALPTVHSTVLLATGSADGDAYLFDVGGSSGVPCQTPFLCPSPLQTVAGGC